jgi:hypothetical protein
LYDVEATPSDIVLRDPTVEPIPVSGDRTATLSKTQASQTLGADAVVSATADLSTAQAGQTLAATVAVAEVADLAITQAGNTLAATVSLIDLADLSKAQAAQTVAGVAVVDVVATLGKTQDSQTLSADSTADAGGARLADLSVTQAGNTLAADATADQPVVVTPPGGGGSMAVPMRLFRAPRLAALVVRQADQGVIAPPPARVVVLSLVQAGDGLVSVSATKTQHSQGLVADGAVSVASVSAVLSQPSQGMEASAVVDWRDLIAEDDELLLQHVA